MFWAGYVLGVANTAAAILTLGVGLAANVATKATDLASTAPRFVAGTDGIIDTASSALRKQIGDVVDSLTTTGRPPVGVRQGGLPGQPGVYANRGLDLPAQPRGYYSESDVWPGTGPRGTERIITGKNGETWYSPDHYGTFRSWP
ncbi:MAG: hypothetical protein KDB18_06840 [Salinibacterium sp.]|nr:hypothetical protein [Salinibacterium sp.]